jgi:hypothetical protein
MMVQENYDDRWKERDYQIITQAMPQYLRHVKESWEKETGT